MSEAALIDLAARVYRLEAERAIRELKARYLRACDLKDPEGVRDTLDPEGATIDFEGFPRFDDRDAFVAVYRGFGCAAGIFDIHHGANGIVELISDSEATGRWSLLFHNINLASRTLTQMGVEYEDRYIQRDGRWWIAETRSRRTSFLTQAVDGDGTTRVMAMGAAPDAPFGQTA
ncbi:nuclear transport factor 2 family protein [Leptolyngbya sp. 15MV]|nr:nuclear transport factor 2 family protein [Leptolyngbya sp. 15MV]